MLPSDPLFVYWDLTVMDTAQFDSKFWLWAWTFFEKICKQTITKMKSYQPTCAIVARCLRIRVVVNKSGRFKPALNATRLSTLKNLRCPLEPAKAKKNTFSGNTLHADRLSSNVFMHSTTSSVNSMGTGRFRFPRTCTTFNLIASQTVKNAQRY